MTALVLVAAVTAAFPPALAAATDSALICVTSHVTASPLDTVELRVIAETDSAEHQYRWTVTGGEIVGRDSVVRWVLERAGLGLYTASADVVGAASRAECSVRVLVVPPPGHMGAPIRTTLRARALLTAEQTEQAGYAVYSYLLLGSRPDSASYERYRLAVAEFVRLTEDIDAFHAAQQQEKGAFNMNYLPVTRTPLPPHADSVLKYYDYARAQRLMRSLPVAPAGGPYLVSVPGASLSRLDSLPAFSILQDLSTVPDPVVTPWVRHFMNLATQQRFDGGAGMQSFVLRLRTAIGVAALGLAEVTESLAKWKETWERLVTVSD